MIVMKVYFQKKDPKIIPYRDYNNFSENEYRKIRIKLVNDRSQHLLHEILLGIYKQNSPNQNAFMNKKFSKAIMDRARLRNKQLKSQSAESGIAYNKIKGEYYNILTINIFGNM